MRNSFAAVGLSLELLLPACAHIEKPLQPTCDPVMEGIRAIQTACREGTAVYYSLDMFCKNRQGRLVRKKGDEDTIIVLAQGESAPCKEAAFLVKNEKYAEFSSTCRELGGQPSIDLELNREMP